MTAPNPLHAPAGTHQILLVEDEESHALLITRAFESPPTDYAIDVVRTLAGAREFLEHYLPALVIADFRLPDGDGIELLSNQPPDASEYPVVIMTGHGDEQVAVRTMRAGALDYIVKSEASMADMRRIADRALREWHHIQERRKAEAALALSEERYALAAKAANDGLWDWNLESDTVYYSPRLQAVLGFPEDGLGNSIDAAFRLVHTDDLELLRAAIDGHLQGGTPHLECECRMRNREGRYRWMLMRGLAVREPNGRAYRMAGSLTDITERKLAEAQLQHDALHDALTGLPNRALFMDRLRMCLEYVQRRDDYRFAVLFIDLDRFKVVNDSLGHVVGDQLLRSVARRMIDCLRTGDTVCRFGGDEFSVLLDGIEGDGEARIIAQRIADSIGRIYRLADDEVYITASIGLALSSDDYQSSEDVIRDADTAMFRAKSQRRGHVELFRHAMRTDVREQLHLENDLRRAIEREELAVYYQPIVSLVSGRITGFEALVRWQHQQRGLLTPVDFIPLAEETRLISAIDRFVLNRACQDMSNWLHKFGSQPLSVSVNLSATQFTEPDLVRQTLEALDATSLPPRALRLEVTENMVIENAEVAADLIETFHNNGIGLAMDDFGTGYSSLSYLHRFPFDTLKIDRSFISQMTNKGNGLEIVRTIVTLARTLNMNVTAEGVETARQLELLRELECPTAQGFWFSHPVDAEAAETLLRKEPLW